MLVRLVTLLTSAGLLMQAAHLGPQTPADRLFQSVRTGDLAGVRSELASGADVNARDAEGSTPLMYAALYAADTACMRLLLERGADPNASNGFGGTALIWGTGSLEKVKLLVEHGADVNARSKLGKSALLVGASRDGAGPVVSYLLAHGARSDIKDELQGIPVIPIGGGGATAVIQAAKARDGEALAALLKKGADVNAKEKNGSTALLNAVAYQNYRNIKLLLARGADVSATNSGGISALILAAMRDDAQTASSLLARGAKVDAEDMWGNTALMWAAYSDRARPELVKFLLESGANADHKNKLGETAFTWAARRGATSVTGLLKDHASSAETNSDGVDFPTSATVLLTDNRNLFAAIEKSLPMLQKAGPAVFKQRGCVSCHNNMLPAIAATLARSQGHKIDEQAMQLENKTLLSVLKPARELLIENGDNIPDLQVTAPYALMTLAAQDYRPDGLTDAVVHNLANKQNVDGSWTLWAPRPPIEYGDIQATALSLRALELYRIEGRRSEFETRVRKAGAWLAKANPGGASDENWKLLGLFWSKAGPEQIAQSARLVLNHQRADGGWAQLPGLGSDAYATGQSLYALAVAGTLDTNSAAWKRGIAYLLKTQQADGTWRVKSRSFPFQPYFESGFPYGSDQWISMAGSSWATIALTMASKETFQSTEALLRKP
ncbi:MAG TPA: ankyrin repeat domain-containing protein [Edaphobacter sp.]|nr:ankyrin repeat domain-containing protein [Edaphobacter sp.]